MIRVAIGALVVLLFHGFARAAECTVVTDGTIEVYMHELAHCNGWEHPPFKPGYDPPAKFVHPFNGELTVYLAGQDYADMMSTMDYAQMGVKFILMPNRSPPQMCALLWKQNDVSAAKDDVDRVIGCAIR